MSYDSTIHAKAVELTQLNYEMTAASGSGHPTTGASLAHIVAILMCDHMRYEPANPLHLSSDRLVLSEGHAVPIVYAACADRNVMVGKDREHWKPLTANDCLTLRQIDSVVDGHPNPIEGFPFFDAATGSLGQGLSVAAGLAAAAKINALDKRIFCIIGDGESREGQVWEALDFIIDEKLTGVCPIFNCNVFAQSGEASPQQSADTLAKKLKAFGFCVIDVDGHQPSQIKDAFEQHAKIAGKNLEQPVAIVARTVKGWGSPSQQGNGHHGKPAVGDGLKLALEELQRTGRSLGMTADMPLRPAMLPMTKPKTTKAQGVVDFDQACEKQDLGKILETCQCATRRAYGIALRSIGHAIPNVVALDADVRGSTHADDFFNDKALRHRFLDCRIGEQNMFSVAAGLSAGGKIPFASTFAKFVTRAYDQIEMAINSGANLKIVGSHAGISLAADGPSQMALPDVAWFRAFATMQNKASHPGCYVLTPSDAYQAYALTVAMAEYHGPCYLRTGRPAVEFLYSAQEQFTLGGHELLIEGKDIMICASGYMVHEVNQAIEILDQHGIDPTVVDMYSIPFDKDAILDIANNNNGIILTVEDNYGNALGSAIADAVCEDGGAFTVEQMHVRHIPKSGLTPDDVLRAAGLHAEDIAKKAMALLSLIGVKKA